MIKYIYIIALISLYFTNFNHELNLKNSHIEECRRKDKYGYFKFLMKTNGNVSLKKSLNFEGICFKNIVATLTDKGKYFLLKIKSSHKKHILCKEVLLINNYLYVNYKTQFIGSSSLKIKKKKEKLVGSIYSNGLNIMSLCDSYSNNIKNIYDSLKLFIGGLGLNPNIPIFGSHIPKYQEKANLEMIEMFNNYKFKKLDKLDTIDYNKFDSGDVIMITRFDGIDNIIGIGTGSRIGHTCIIIKDEEENETYVYESQNAMYWPKKKIQRNKLSTWIKWAQNADYNVIWIPLSEESRKKFNHKKAKEFADSMLGVQYGFRNFLFGWIDTKDKNFPYILDMDFIFIIFKILEKISKKITDGFFTEGLNWRLGTKNLSLEEISEVLVERNLRITDILPIVEEEGIEYSNGKNYVCSSYVVAILKRGGIFGDLNFHATEMTPRDLYTLNVFNNKEIAGCINKYYCQFIGNINIELDQYNTREPYEHMHEKCESQAPLFNYNGNC